MKSQHATTTVRRSRQVAQPQRKAWLPLCATALLALGVAQAESAEYISTLDAPTYSSAGIGSTVWAGISFKTDSQSYELEGITGYLHFYSGSAGLALGGRLYIADATGKPVTLLTDLTFTYAPITVGNQYVTFTPTATFELEANTTYAFVIAPQVGVNGYWHTTQATNTPTTDVVTSSWTMPAYIPYTMDSGGNWMDAGGTGTQRAIGGIYATAIPEPSSLLLLSIAGVAGWKFRRRFQR